jgi:hypothetical protein
MTVAATTNGLGHLALGVNIDHVATLRQARRIHYPSPLEAALVAERAGADNITLHLREDRRHIQDADVEAIRPSLATRMNLEVAVTDEMIRFACRIRPADCCLVPERRAEITTEGGLDIVAQVGRLSAECAQLAADRGRSAGRCAGRRAAYRSVLRGVRCRDGPRACAAASRFADRGRARSRGARRSWSQR